MKIIRIKRILMGKNEDGSSWYSPETPPEPGYVSCVVDDETDEYVYEYVASADPALDELPPEPVGE